jgi:hypothetical protein
MSRHLVKAELKMNRDEFTKPAGAITVTSEVAFAFAIGHTLPNLATAEA